MKQFKKASCTILAITMLLGHGTLLAENNDSETPKKKCSITVHKKNGGDTKVINTDDFSELQNNPEVKELFEKHGITLESLGKDNEVLTIQVNDNSKDESENINKQVKVIRIKKDGVSEKEGKTLNIESVDTDSEITTIIADENSEVITIDKRNISDGNKKELSFTTKNEIIIQNPENMEAEWASADGNGDVTIVTESGSSHKRVMVFTTNDDIDTKDEGTENIRIRTHVIVNGDEQTTDLQPINMNEDERSKGPGASTYSFSSLSTDEKLNKIKKAYVIITSDKKVLKNNEVDNGTSSLEVRNTTSESDIEEQVSMENNSLNVQVYPNPNNGMCTLNFNSSNKGNALIEVSDTEGKIIFTEIVDTPAGEFKKNIDLSNQPKGAYFIKITQGNAIAKVQTIIE